MAGGEDDPEQDFCERLDRLLGEAMGLVQATKHYLERRPAGAMPVAGELGHLCELDRVTCRLGLVIGWLLRRKAELAGDGPAAAAIEDDPHCLQQPALAELPPALGALLDASAVLYGRTVRMAAAGECRPDILH
ncbi:MAG TPA: DUF1465 family protein [Geminicoccus sp.]|uniref:DUF1465 family protein n=1 Tax=Geminicoccus sp. TaxID=2024832 RepID=UPI002BAEA167|nr:DUF1465 family protein [Geminicoccus sp.]HWL71709.1 DUF1465 family protein [Geminicoccus sp.]